jgi:hypothetical protein
MRLAQECCERALSSKMQDPSHGCRFGDSHFRFRPIIVALLLLPGLIVIAQTDDASKIPEGELDSLVAPVALYPDHLLSQVLVASTYPLEIMQLQQFLQNNPHLKDKALADGVELKPWDPSIKAMAIFPDVVKRLSDDIRWTTDLGNAFLAQESDVLDAIQRMRARAEEKGMLQTVDQQIVGTETVEGGQQVITIEPADPETVYVPIYDPTITYGALPYPYPPIYYPPPGYYAPGRALAFAVGVALGRAWNGGWGYGCAWGSRDITINRTNKFVRNSPTYRNVATSRADKWQHSPSHRGGAPYSSPQLTNKYSSQMPNLSGGNRLDNGTRATNLQQQLRDRPAPAPAQVPRPNAADRIGNQGPSSFGNTGAFNGGNRDVTRASSSRGVSRMGGFHGGGARGGGRRR